MQSDVNTFNESVLIVDDASIVRMACQRALKRAGFEVFTAENGQKAIELVQEHSVDAVLLDVKMPVMNGLEFMRLLSDFRPWAEVVVMTAYIDNAMVEELRKLGVYTVISKPFSDVKSVVRKVAAAVVKSRKRRGMPADSRTLLNFILVDTGRMTRTELIEAEQEAGNSGRAVLEVLEQKFAVSGEDLEWAIAEFLDIQYVHLDPEMITGNELVYSVPADEARKLQCMPLFKEDGQVHVVSVDPYSDLVKEELEKRYGCPVVLYKGSPAEIESAIKALESWGPKEIPGS